MQKPFDNGRSTEAAIRRAMGQGQPTGVPMVADSHGKPIGVPSVVMALNKPVLDALEEMVRRVVREELARLDEESPDGAADG